MLKLLREYISILLTEAKSDQLKSKFPHLELEIDELIAGGVETKYLDWAVKQLTNKDDPVSTDEVIVTLNYFHKNIQRVKGKDISSYKNLKSLMVGLESIGVSRRQKTREALVKGSERVGETEDYKIYYVNDYEASVILGSGTKWCVSGKNLGDSYFWDYYFSGSRFYFCISKVDLGDDELFYGKIAVVIKRGDIEVFDARDNHILNDKIKDLKDLTNISKEDYYLKGRNYVNFKEFVDHPSSEARLHAAENANDQSALLSFARDESIKVRKKAISRIDTKYLLELFEMEEDQWTRGEIVDKVDKNDLIKFVDHSDSLIRSAAALRIDPEYLPQMIDDPSEDVRWVVARRIDPDHLPQMMEKEDDCKNVRRTIAQRIDLEYLHEMMNDIDYHVRLNVATRIGQDYLHKMFDDPHDTVRKLVAKKVDPEYLPKMLDDPKSEVRRIVKLRLETLGMI